MDHRSSPPKKMALRILPVKDEGDLAAALAIREVVFIEEQQVPASFERDAEDAQAFHMLAYDGGHAIGTGRLVALDQAPEGEQGRWGRIGRMAVLATWRKHGVGRALLASLESEARRRGLNGIVLHAQLFTREFYRKVGYRDVGPIFEEAGMAHVQMKKMLEAT